MKFGVIVYPGSNCDDDMLYLIGEDLGQEVERLWHKDKDLKGCDFLILPGGFAYGDYLRAGAIARFSPIMESVIQHANDGGFVYGICNGFQILTESHLLPGVLLNNDHRKYTCKNVHLVPQTNNSHLTRNMDLQKAYQIPVAHGEGRFYADEATIKSLNENDQVLFRYCDKNGKVSDGSNPNGSIENIAGICNKGRNVFGMMPHPERSASVDLGCTDGLAVFESILSPAKSHIPG